MKNLSLQEMQTTTGGSWWGCALSITMAVGSTLALASNPVGWGLALAIGLKAGSYFGMADSCSS